MLLFLFTVIIFLLRKIEDFFVFINDVDRYDELDESPPDGAAFDGEMEMEDNQSEERRPTEEVHPDNRELIDAPPSDIGGIQEEPLEERNIEKEPATGSYGSDEDPAAEDQPEISQESVVNQSELVKEITVKIEPPEKGKKRVKAKENQPGPSQGELNIKRRGSPDEEDRKDRQVVKTGQVKIEHPEEGKTLVKPEVIIVENRETPIEEARRNRQLVKTAQVKIEHPEEDEERVKVEKNEPGPSQDVNIERQVDPIGDDREYRRLLADIKVETQSEVGGSLSGISQDEDQDEEPQRERDPNDDRQIDYQLASDFQETSSDASAVEKEDDKGQFQEPRERGEQAGGSRRSRSRRRRQRGKKSSKAPQEGDAVQQNQPESSDPAGTRRSTAHSYNTRWSHKP